MAAAGLVTLVAFVSPYRKDRERARRWVESRGNPGDFLEVFVDTPLHVCMQRDPKGLYRQALQGKLAGMTGLDDPYEPPEAPDLRLAGDQQTPRDHAAAVVALLRERQIIP